MPFPLPFPPGPTPPRPGAFGIRNEADPGPWKIALQPERRSGDTYDISHTGDDLMAALFGPGG